MGALLELEGVTCTLGGVRAVDDVSLSVVEGNITGIVGPNGAGKTTLFNAVTGFVPYSDGDVRWAGTSVRGWAPHKIANTGLTRTFQNFGGYGSMTVEENVAVAARRWGGDAATTVCDLLGLTPHLVRKVDDCGLATRKLVGIAMAAVRDPRMLLLDEPLAGLDVHERDGVVAMIRLVHAEGVTIVLIEHDVSRVLQLADHVAILDTGAKVADGTPAELSGMPELLNVYLKA